MIPDKVFFDSYYDKADEIARDIEEARFRTVSPTPEEEKEAFEANACYEAQNHLKECEKCAPTNQTPEWEKEFDEKFLRNVKNPLGWLLPRVAYFWEESGKGEVEWEDMEKELKDFISNLLTSHSHKIKEEIESMKKDAKWMMDNYFTAENAFPTFDKVNDFWVAVVAKEQYNKALSDVKKLLESKE